MLEPGLHLDSIVKVNRTGHEGPEGKQRYSSTPSLTSALDMDGWSTPLTRPL